MPNYEALSKEISDRIANERKTGNYVKVAFDNDKVIRRQNIAKDSASIWRPTFVHDIDKIMHCPYYNRYTDKTQVFSLYKNDDITRRSLHVQLVSRISRTIGVALNLNLDLIEAIALGHDLGHPPFAHTGEKYLSELYHQHTGRYFYHNVHSARVLDGIFPYNISLQVLDGIACHNGEFELEELIPSELSSFEDFDKMIEKCYVNKDFANRIMPSTLEGCVVRLSDIIAYLGKDRQDAMRANLTDENEFENDGIGSINAEIINNLVVNIIENSYGKPYIKLDFRHFRALKKAKRDNYDKIYNYEAKKARLDLTVKPMMEQIYGTMLDDLKNNRQSSFIFKHHIDYVNRTYYKRTKPYESSDPNQIVVDYIASMTDSYFIELYRALFPDSDLKVQYKGYFNQ